MAFQTNSLAHSLANRMAAQPTTLRHDPTMHYVEATDDTPAEVTVTFDNGTAIYIADRSRGVTTTTYAEGVKKLTNQYVFMSDEVIFNDIISDLEHLFRTASAA